MISTLALFAFFACDPGQPEDTGPFDSGNPEVFPRDGFGALSGDCDVLDTELTDAAPGLFSGNLDLPSGPPEASALTEGGAEILADGNLGGNSIWSEILAFEVLSRCEAATLLKSEGEIAYTGEGKRTDMLVELDGGKIGVSVVRAFRYPPGTPYELADATETLNKKLADIQESSALVAEEDAWGKQILGVIAYDETAADSVRAAFEGLEASVKADTLVWVTTTDGDDAWVYTNE
jgi:hypothetical protein